MTPETSDQSLTIKFQRKLLASNEWRLEVTVGDHEFSIEHKPIPNDQHWFVWNPMETALKLAGYTDNTITEYLRDFHGSASSRTFEIGIEFLFDRSIWNSIPEHITPLDPEGSITNAPLRQRLWINLAKALDHYINIDNTFTNLLGQQKIMFGEF